MKAYFLETAGPVDNLLLKDDVDQPSIQPNEVLIKVKCISINPVDYKVRSSDPFITMIMQTEDRPVILGWDVSGVVEKVGSDVATNNKFQPGDRVFGMVNLPGQGKAYAEYVAAPADHLAKIPDGMSFEEAAATTLAALTALQAMRSRVKVGDKVLIHAGSGGVGHFAIQIAKCLGATTVVATSSAKNKEFCTSHGADEHVDYRAQKFEEVVSDADFVLDGMGGETLERSLKAVKDGGKIVSLPSPDFEESVVSYAKNHNLSVEFIFVTSSGDDQKTLGDMFSDGKLKPHILKTFSFDEMPEAHRQLESGRTVGKIVVNV